MVLELDFERMANIHREGNIIYNAKEGLGRGWILWCNLNMKLDIGKTGVEWIKRAQIAGFCAHGRRRMP